MRPETEADDRRHANGINDLNVVFSKEVARHFSFNHLESAGVGLESTKTPEKRSYSAGTLLMECNWSAAVRREGCLHRRNRWPVNQRFT